MCISCFVTQSIKKSTQRSRFNKVNNFCWFYQGRPSVKLHLCACVNVPTHGVTDNTRSSNTAASCRVRAGPELLPHQQCKYQCSCSRMTDEIQKSYSALNILVLLLFAAKHSRKRSFLLITWSSCQMNTNKTSSLQIIYW